MPRPKVSIPKYSKHGPSGQAVVYLDRRRIYLGKFGSPESKRKYAELIASRSSGLDPELLAPDAPSVSVNEVCLAFVKNVMPKYRTADGKPSDEQECLKGVIRILRELFGESPATKFGPVKLRTAREAMIGRGWKRSYINKQVGRVRFIFRMAASWEMIPATVVVALKTMEPLRAGDSKAPESVPRRAVPAEHIEAAKKHLRERNRDLIDLLLVTAARPGEILSLTTQMIDRSGEVWFADLARHKTAHHGHARTLHFGPKAQAILMKYLRPLNPSVRLFPIQRKTFGQAVKDACVKAKVPPFTPHWLRHTAVTNVVDEVDLDSAQALAGHSTRSMTILYSRAAGKKAKAAVKKLG